MKQVRWPKKKEMVKYSFAVLLCILILSLFFVASDLLISAVRTIIGGL
ncbi:MAG: preprotein translocase subunit SecE [Bacilli bacterium]|nr:preprotein translocase subunit SecE [Bacilli bacterium]